MKFLSPTFAGSFDAAVKRSVSRLAVLLAAFFVLFAAQALAQEATIVGTVTDPSGAAVPNAKVTVTNVETESLRTFHHEQFRGQYTAVDIHIGHYYIKVEASGFKSPRTKEACSCRSATVLVPTSSWPVGGSSETVTVEANTVAVQSDNGEVSSVITGEQIAQPVHQWPQHLPAEPLWRQARPAQIDVTLPTLPWAALPTWNITAFARTTTSICWTAARTTTAAAPAVMSIAPSADAIAEFRTLTSNYSADYGLSSAGTNVLVLKSGTKDYHAAAWEFNRNDAFDARTYNNRAPEPGGRTAHEHLRV